ncbi:MAG: FtsX-like permease family protein [Roseivirga sp.]|nr:FtsX-like permease family protein [Roseivirga sp.]
MSSTDENRPPKSAYKLFKWFCDSRYFEELQGDLEEHFYRNRESLGHKKASSIYWKSVLGMIRPSVISQIKIKYPLNNSAMFRNYSLVALRSIARNKLFSFINIIGLAISMVVGLLAIAFITELYSYDAFHEKKDRIHRVIITQHEGDQEPAFYASVSPLLGRQLETDYTSFEKVVTIYRNLNGDVKKGDNTVSLNGFYATEDFFDVFTFPMIHGSPSSALSDPFSLVLTETSALKVFGKIDVVGEVISWNNQNQLKVTGVVKDPPRTSHMNFQAIASFGFLEKLNARNTGLMSWQNMWNSHVYILLPESGSTTNLQADLDKIAAQENPKLYNSSFEPELQSLTSIFPGRKLNNQLGARMELKNINYIVILAIIVLASAAFNYTNLSIARTLKRAKEVGVRKVVGAQRRQVFLQFIIEAVIVSLMALVIAYFLFQLVRPEFLSLNRDIQRTSTLELSAIHYLYFLLFSVGVGILSGFFPSVILSRLKPSAIVKGVSRLKSASGLSLRKLLVGIQFTLSIGFVLLVGLAGKQYDFALNYDLGFETENILNIYLQNNDVDLLSNSLAQLPEVETISKSSWVPSVGGIWTNRGKYIEGNDSTTVNLMNVNGAYISNLGHELLAGDIFTDGLDRTQIVVNEQLVKRFRMGEPIDALGKRVRLQGRNRTIVGVVRDFQHATLDNEVAPFAFLSEPNGYRLLNLKISSDDMAETMLKIEAAWSELDPVHEFQAFFYQDRIERAYASLSTSTKTLGLLAIIAIVISILGLLGMAVYTTESRIKELTIRKVLGATTSHLLRLLSRNFVIMFVVTSAVAVPLSLYAFKELIIPGMVHTINIGFWDLSRGLLIIFGLTAVIIGSQALKAARNNPVKNLRSE